MAEIPQNIIAQIKRKDIANIADRAKAGKPLTDAQLSRLEAFQADPQGPQEERYVTSKTELAETFGVTRQALHDMCKAGLVMPHKTKNGYSVAKFKENYLDFQERRDGIKAHSPREKKLNLECERLEVNIKIDNERLKQVELETKRQKGELMPVAEHKQKMVAAAQLYVTSIEQGIQNASTQMRSAEMRAVLEKVFNAVRKRVARSIEG